MFFFFLNQKNPDSVDYFREFRHNLDVFTFFLKILLEVLVKREMKRVKTNPALSGDSLNFLDLDFKIWISLIQILVKKK